MVEILFEKVSGERFLFIFFFRRGSSSDYVWWACFFKYSLGEVFWDFFGRDFYAKFVWLRVSLHRLFRGEHFFRYMGRIFT